MKWEQDLVYDIRMDDPDFDDRDGVARHKIPWANGTTEVSPCNLASLRSKFLPVVDSCRAILEIGINRNGDGSFTQVFLKNKRVETIYVGLDIDDKTYLNDPSKRVYTIRNDSSYIDVNMIAARNFGVEEFDFIFIDGYHSINQVLRDWEYTRFLSPKGIVGFHDTTAHPGPSRFVKALNREKWNVEVMCPDDFGIGFAWRKV